MWATPNFFLLDTLPACGEGELFNKFGAELLKYRFDDNLNLKAVNSYDGVNTSGSFFITHMKNPLFNNQRSLFGFQNGYIGYTTQLGESQQYELTLTEHLIVDGSTRIVGHDGAAYVYGDLYIYFYDLEGAPKLIRDDLRLGIRQIAIDSEKNAYVTVLNESTTPETETLYVMDSEGTIFKQFRFSEKITINSGWGICMFISGDDLYIITADNVLNRVNFDCQTYTAILEPIYTDPDFWQLIWPASCHIGAPASNCGSNIYDPSNIITNTHEVDQLDIRLSPNPVQESLTLQNLTLSETYEVAIFNLQGQLIMQQKIKGDNSELSVQDLSSGLYILGLSTPSQNGIQRMKFMKL